jgi:hypothetical protein
MNLWKVLLVDGRQIPGAYVRDYWARSQATGKGRRRAYGSFLLFKRKMADTL